MIAKIPTLEDLKRRVEQFQMMELPGQPMGMHMGTLYLVMDLQRALEDALTAKGEPT